MSDFKEKFAKFRENIEKRRNRFESIQQLFVKLQQAHEYISAHSGDDRYWDKCNELLEKVEVIYQELEVLGIEKREAAAFFISEGRADDETIASLISD